MSEITNYGILIVDDDESFLNTMRRTLKREKFSKIISALNAKQAFRILESVETAFALIISDQEMPGMKGIEFLNKTIEVSPLSRRILLTGYPDFSSVIKAINHGAIHKYIIKPPETEDLIKKIKSELKIYDRYAEKKKLINITRSQTLQFFKVAKQLKYKNKKFLDEIKLKQDEKKSLQNALAKIKEEQNKNKKFQGLNTVLLKNILLKPNSLLKAFNIIKTQIDSFFKEISENNGIEFPFRPSAKKSSQYDSEQYEIIDLIIECVVRKTEPLVSKIGLDHDHQDGKKLNIDEYTDIPDTAKLAYQEGYITEKELERVEKEHAKAEKQTPPGLSIEQCLIDLNLIDRIKLSRLMVKKRLIEIRLKDREFAEELIKREAVSVQTIEQAFIKQLNYFEHDSNCMTLGDILVQENAITAQLRDELFRAHHRINEIAESSGISSLLSSSKKDILIDLQISPDKTKAYIRLPKSLHGSSDIKPVKDLLQKHGIRFGVVEDKLILGFMRYASDPEKKFTIAMGRYPEPGKNAQVRYHFNTEYQKPGIVAEDGTIDFRDRGDIPFVEKGALLAEKIPLIKGKLGLDIFGEPIPVDDVKDCVFKNGSGTELDESGLKIYAAIEGQPSLNTAGVVSVLKELNIKNNVDFETGHINFNGNVFVKGVVKEGFHVNCVDLTAGEINGGIITLSGNLNVSTGIINAQVTTSGNVKSKFINNSKVDAFGNITIIKEIMESDIAVSGECINDNGRVTSSLIAAKKGFTLGLVGTLKASPSTIKAGVDDHMVRLEVIFDKKIEKQQAALDVLEQKKKLLENKNFEMHKKVADYSFAQETMMKKISSLKQELLSLKSKKAEMIKVVREIKEMENTMKEYDDIIKNIFSNQDKITKDISNYEKKITSGASELEITKLEKKAMEEIAEFDEPVPVVRINRNILAGNKIVGPKSSMVVKHKLGACKIMEIDSSDPDDREGRQMVIQNL